MLLVGEASRYFTCVNLIRTLLIYPHFMGENSEVLERLKLPKDMHLGNRKAKVPSSHREKGPRVTGNSILQGNGEGVLG